MRNYGISNAAPYASAPALGPAGDIYFNTTSKLLFVSDGIAWRPFPPTYTLVSDAISQRPNPREGEIVYITSEDALRLYDGTTWRPVNLTYHWFSWSTDTTATDPATGYIKTNNADPNLATVLYINVLNLNRDYVMSAISAGIGDTITIYWMLDLNSWATYAVTGAPTVSGNAVALPVTLRAVGMDGWAALPNNERVAVIVTPGGDKVASSSLPSGGDTYQVLVNAGGGTPAWGWAEGAIRRIDQNAHGFSVGQLLKLTPSGYALAQADTEANAEVCGAVYSVISANAFVISLQGRIGSGFSGLTLGQPLYLSPTTPGGYTATEPTTPGQISKPVFIAEGSGSVYFINMRGNVIPNPLGGTGIRVPHMRRYRSVAPSLTSGAWVQGDFDQIRTGQNTAQSTDFTWDSTNNGFKIVQAGLYLFTFTMNGFGSTGRRAVMFTCPAGTGNEWSRNAVQNISSTQIGMAHSDVRYCAKDDLVCVYTYQDSGTLWNQLLTPFDFTCTLLSPG